MLKIIWLCFFRGQCIHCMYCPLIRFADGHYDSTSTEHDINTSMHQHFKTLDLHVDNTQETRLQTVRMLMPQCHLQTFFSCQSR